MNLDNIQRIIPLLPVEVRDRVKDLCENYKRTKDERCITLILKILEQFDDKREILDLVKQMK